MLGQPQHHPGKIDRKRDGHQEHDVDRQRRAQCLAEADADELRGHQQYQSVRRRDQAKGQGRDQHDAHVNAVNVAGLGQRVHQRHEDDDGRHRLDEIADHREQQLGSYELFQRSGPMQASVWEKMMRALSTRNCAAVVKDFQNAYGIEKSAVSENFIEASREKVKELMERPLGELRLCAVQGSPDGDPFHWLRWTQNGVGAA